MDIIERLNDDAQCFCSIRKEAADEIERLREALGKYDCLHKCTEPCALYYMEKAKEADMPHMICGWWASDALTVRK